MRTSRLLPLTAVAALVAGPLVAGSTAAIAAAPLQYDTTWTVDSVANSVTEYAATAHGAATALVTISGAATKLDDPSGVVVGNEGRIYVTNAGGDTITVYAPGAANNAKPVAVIGGSKTGLDGPSSITIAGDQLWVTDPASNVIEAFSAESHGNELPAASFSGAKTELDHPIAISMASDFLPFIYVLNKPASGTASVTGYLPEDTGNVKPLERFTLSGFDPTGLMAADLDDLLIVDGSHNRVVEALDEFGTGGLHVARQIKGTATGLNDPVSIAHDALGRLVVGNAGNHTVSVFSPEAHGNVAPLRTITGVGSAAGQPAGMTEFGIAPAEPTAVTATRHGDKVTLNWSPPAVTGGGVIGYDLDVETGTDEESGGITEVSTIGGGSSIQTDTTRTTAVKTIRPGHRYSFRVIAVNAFGQSSESAPAFAAIVTKPGKVTQLFGFAHKSQMFVIWEPPSLDGGTGHLDYRIEYATCKPGAKGCTFKSKSASRAPLMISGLKKHAKYHVRIVARNRKGAGKPSKVVTAHRV